jgi:hypothetical protein
MSRGALLQQIQGLLLHLLEPEALSASAVLTTLDTHGCSAAYTYHQHCCCNAAPLARLVALSIGLLRFASPVKEELCSSSGQGSCCYNSC